MVDRINNVGVSHGRKIDTGRSENAKASNAVSPESKVESPRSETDITGNSLISRTRDQIDASDGIDRQKVDAIKTAIRNGEFAIDAKAVAKAFVELELMAGN